MLPPPGLDYAFLQYIGVSIDGERALHSIYLPFLQGKQRVLDLGCGMGGFVKLLCEAGFDAYGVDSDPQCIADARAHQLPVVEADVIDHLRSLEPATLDAIFSAHMVEHLPYAVVLEMIQLAQRALKPGGRLLLVTPNPRALITHLELYHMHFGHIALYHPKLLAFFMHHAGFAATSMGENPQTRPANVSADSPLIHLAGLAEPSVRPIIPPATRETIFPAPNHPFRKLIWYAKMKFLRRWIESRWIESRWIEPMLKPTQDEVIRLQQEVTRLQQAFQTTLQAVDRPFECYVIGDK